MIDKFRRKGLGLYVSIFLYRFASAVREKWLDGFEQLITSLNGFNIIYVFDSTPSSEKDHTMEQRKERAEDAKKYCEEMKKEIKEYERNEEVGELLLRFTDNEGKVDLE